MGFLDLAKKRYSVRKYLPQKVEKEKLLAILEAGRAAPTAHNNQPVKIIAVQEIEGLNKLKKAANAYDAPLALIICGEPKTAWVRAFDNKNYADIDAAIVTTHMMMQATELGLGTVWIGYFDPKIVKEEFKLPNDVEPLNVLAVGYAAGTVSPPNRHDKERKPLANLVSYEIF